MAGNAYGYGNPEFYTKNLPKGSALNNSVANQGNIFGSMFDTTTTGKNGIATTQQGWGAPVANAALGAWGLYNQMQGQDAAQEDADRRWNLMENDSKKNWAMRMNEYRQFQNRISRGRANEESVLSGNGSLRGDDAAQFQQGSNMLDWKGNQTADPFSTDAAGNFIGTSATQQTNPMQATNPITGGPSIRNQLSNINNIAGSAFAPQAPMNSGEKLASRATTTPTQKAGGSDVKKKMPGDKSKVNEQDRVKKLTV